VFPTVSPPARFKFVLSSAASAPPHFIQYFVASLIQSTKQLPAVQASSWDGSACRPAAEIIADLQQSIATWQPRRRPRPAGGPGRRGRTSGPRGTACSRLVRDDKEGLGGLKE
jgi:hypothetical protein